MYKSKKIDYFNKNKPVHKLSYCAFLDVLGFSERISASYNNDTEDQLLERFHEILSRNMKAINDNSRATHLYYKAFTDNVVLSYPQVSDDMETEFASILESICRYQLSMALEGFFIRGGLALGKLFMDKNSVYGKALLEAYRLESKVAVNPIVVLCDDAMKSVKLHLSFYMGGDAPQRNHLLVGPDGRFFLNYLGQCVTSGADDWHLDAKSLAQHKEQIETALREYVAIPAVFSKFAWLAAYHNHFCKTVTSFSNYNDDLKIDVALAAIKFKKIDKKK